MSNRRLTIALVGNPNSGKTTLFNALTGSRQHVGNYPGVTVEKKEGFATHNSVELDVVDLPGIYSLTAYSLDEIIARNFVIEEKPDVVVDIIDASNLERHLYLATQLLELNVPLILAFNKSDLAAARGMRIDLPKLSGLLGVPIVETVASRQIGLDGLLDAVVEIGADPTTAAARQRHTNYGPEVETHVEAFAQDFARQCPQLGRARWFAVKLLEDDAETLRRLRSSTDDVATMDGLVEQAGRIRKHIHTVCGDSAEIILADRRYGFISGACAETVTKSSQSRRARSDAIDAVLTNRFIGLPVFAVMMFLAFQLTFAVGNPLVAGLETLIDALATSVASVWPEGSATLLRGLLIDGVIKGVGAVLVFVPLIALLFLAISLLEDSGYMARGAFVLDKLMHRMGLHGKSFVPMLVAFGCSVPAIMATRTLESRRDRLTTMMIIPLMSCGARLPVYALILGAFFPARTVLPAIGVTNQALLLWLMYLIGIALAVVSSRLLQATVLRGEATPFVMELPPYRMPTLKGVAMHVWERSWSYIRKAGTIILTIIIVLWALTTWPGLGADDQARFDAQRQAARATLPDEAQQHAELSRIAHDEHRTKLEHSAIGQFGKAVAPALEPCGFDWRISTAMLGAFPAKEAFIGQLGVIFAVADDNESNSLPDQLAAAYTPLTGFAIMLFILISSPCMATVAVTMRESGSWKWAMFQWTYLTALAWVVTAGFYQIGRLVVG